MEFLVAIRVRDTYVGGFENTGWDFTFDAVGVTTAAVFLVASRAPRRPARDGRALLLDPVTA